MRHSKIIFSWLVLNFPLLMIVAAGFITGLLTPVFQDITYITHTIFGLFLFSLFYSAKVAWNLTTTDNDQLKKIWLTLGDRAMIVDILDNQFKFLRFMINFLMGLGFIGTVIGVIIGFSNFPADAFTNVDAMQVFVRQMLLGFATELNTLVMGLATSLWLSVVVFMLEYYQDGLFSLIFSGKRDLLEE